MISDETFIKFIRGWKEDGITTLDELEDWVREYGVDWTWYEEE